jgi:3-deoxy-D-manno-octulosonate 8-phosphate phosphatase (KDO 8-P phosphatase)
MTEMSAKLRDRLRRVRLVLTDSDGVLTDAGVYYSAAGEELKRFSIRDGMGVARLREHGVETGIVTGENSEPVRRRAQKLGIEELHLGVGDKGERLAAILASRALAAVEVAYIGDDVNDLPAFAQVGFTAAPADALPAVREVADYVCAARGGHGAFRELAEIVIEARFGNRTATA